MEPTNPAAVQWLGVFDHQPLSELRPEDDEEEVLLDPDCVDGVEVVLEPEPDCVLVVDVDEEPALDGVLVAEPVELEPDGLVVVEGVLVDVVSEFGVEDCGCVADG